MNKLNNKSGFTLIEMMCALLILVILVVGMGATMNAGTEIYEDAVFEADSASMAGILNTALGDILRYSMDIRINEGTVDEPQKGFEDSNGAYILADEVGFVFTSVEYGIRDAYFYTPILAGNISQGVLQMKNLRNSEVVELVNTGAYPDLAITNFVITYVEPGASVRGGYFDISYDILSESNDQMRRHVETVVRLMNPQE